MFVDKFAKKTQVLWRLFKHSQAPLTPHRTSHAHLLEMPVFTKFANVIARRPSSLCYSAVTCEHKLFLNHHNGKTNMGSNPDRPYQVVLAATRDMGIGKDGKLPWNLPSDLRYFKELTTMTSIPGKRNAVIMGRKTWESIPQKYRPLPGRLNVVLTRSEKLEAPTLEDVVICRDLQLALKLLGEPPYSLSVERVFVIGGGQVLKEALNAPGCEAIHLTDIETNFDCDTFMPQIDLSLFRKWSSTGPAVENHIRFSFVTYVRESGLSSEESSPSVKDLELRCKKDSELNCLKQVQEIIVNANSGK